MSTAPVCHTRVQSSIIVLPSCLTDIGASCTSQVECSLQFRYQDERTCGAKQVCECTGHGDCGDGHVRDPQEDEDFPATEPGDIPPITRSTSRVTFSTTPGIINAPPRTPTTVRPTIRAAGVGGAGGNSGKYRRVNPSGLSERNILDITLNKQVLPMYAIVLCLQLNLLICTGGSATCYSYFVDS